MTGLFIVGVIALIIVIGFLFVQFSPQFGGKHSEASIAQYKKSGHYENGVFVNEIPTSMEMGFPKMMSVLKDYIAGVPNSTPKHPLPVQSIDSLDIVNRPDTATRVTWFGHSAFLLEDTRKKYFDRSHVW